MQIILTKNQVPVGTVVFPCLLGDDTLKTDAPLILLLGGVPTRIKWYPCDDDGRVVSGGFEFDGMKEEVRYVPARCYSCQEAPTGEMLAVFVSGEHIKYDTYDFLVEVCKQPDGTFASICGYAYDYWHRPYTIPENAVLVPHGKWKWPWWELP